MKKIIKKTDEDYAVLQGFWILLQEFYEPEDTDEYWDGFLKATIALEHAHENNLLCNELILMTLNYFEKKFKKERKKDKTASYAKLLTSVRFAYKDFVDHADSEDKKILDGVLSSNDGVTEQKIILKARQLYAQESIEQLSMFMES